MNKKLTSGIIGVIVFAILVIIDRITKIAVVHHLKGQEPVVLIRNVFELNYLENRGAAFGILQGARVIFLILTVIILAIVIYCYIKAPMDKKFFKFRVMLVFLCAGAVGNMIDRVGQGYVVDFFYFSLINFPIFNVADIYVTFGAIFFIVMILFMYKEPDLTLLGNSLKPKKGQNDDRTNH